MRLTTPVDTIFTRTSPFFGGSTWISSILNGSPAAQAIAALQVITFPSDMFTTRAQINDWNNLSRENAEFCFSFVDLRMNIWCWVQNTNFWGFVFHYVSFGFHYRKLSHRELGDMRRALSSYSWIVNLCIYLWPSSNFHRFQCFRRFIIYMVHI